MQFGHLRQRVVIAFNDMERCWFGIHHSLFGWCVSAPRYLKVNHQPVFRQVFTANITQRDGFSCTLDNPDRDRVHP